MTNTRNRKPAAAGAESDVVDQVDADQVDAAPSGAGTDDDRDTTIAELRAELDAIRATPQGQAAELAKAVAALSAEVDRMKKGTGLVPVPEATDPAPFDYWARLASGEVIEVQYPWITHHHSEQYGTVPVEKCWPKDKEHAAA